MSSLGKGKLREIIKENDFQSVDDVYIYMKDTFKDILQEILEAELDSHLGYGKHDVKNEETDNSRNGHNKKTVKSKFGNLKMQIPRDRKGVFEPKIISRYQRDVAGIEDKVISLYSRGMSTRDINE